MIKENTADANSLSKRKKKEKEKAIILHQQMLFLSFFSFCKGILGLSSFHSLLNPAGTVFSSFFIVPAWDSRE